MANVVLSQMYSIRRLAVHVLPYCNSVFTHERVAIGSATVFTSHPTTAVQGPKCIVAQSVTDNARLRNGRG
jgi:hypothetical protein